MEHSLLIRKCIASGSISDAKQLHERMRRTGHDRDTFLGNLLVDMYGKLGLVEEAGRAFQRIISQNVFSFNIMIAAFAQNGHLQDAVVLFDKMPQKNVVSWNSIIWAYAQGGSPQCAIRSVRLMLQLGYAPDCVTIINALDACAMLLSAKLGAWVNAIATESGLDRGVKVGTALVTAYGKCGQLGPARRVFDDMAFRNQVTWNAMLAAYSLNGHVDEACAVFEEMPLRNVVSWSALMWGYTQAGEASKALALLAWMDQEGVRANATTFLVLFDACAIAVDLRRGRWLHSRASAAGYDRDVAVVTTLVNMYGRCGDVVDARRAFHAAAAPHSVATWNALIGSHARLNHSDHVFELYTAMALEGTAPTDVTFFALLGACCNAGLIEAGRSHFMSMVEDYGIKPSIDHYHCIVDLLARSGKLGDAEELIACMPFHCGASTWSEIVASSRLHEDIGRCENAARHAFAMDPESPFHFALLNAYSADALTKPR